MANPPDCRLQNTVIDLKECANALEQGEQFSSEEEAAKHRLTVLCCSIAAHLNDDE